MYTHVQRFRHRVWQPAVTSSADPSGACGSPRPHPLMKPLALETPHSPVRILHGCRLEWCACHVWPFWVCHNACISVCMIHGSAFLPAFPSRNGELQLNQSYLARLVARAAICLHVLQRLISMMPSHFTTDVRVGVCVHMYHVMRPV